MSFKHYYGPLNTNTNGGMDKTARQAYASWLNQKTRCYNKKSPDFKGKNKIKVEYSSRAFIGWWIYWQNKLNLKTPSISRINHDDDYKFSNVRLEELSENVKERNRRAGNPTPSTPVVMYSWPSMKQVNKFESLHEAARYRKTSATLIMYHCKGKNSSGTKYIKTRDGFTFRYAT